MSRDQTECALNGEIQTGIEKKGRKQASKKQKNPQKDITEICNSHCQTYGEMI